MKADIHKKVNNFFNALKNLKEIEKKEPPYDTITEAGMVALFEICFEQSWKAMKERLEFFGYGERKLGSPNSIIKLAYQAGMIDDEAIWSAALKARNDIIHAYSEEIALRIIEDTKEQFIPMFEELKESIQRDGVFLYEGNEI